MKKIMFVVVAVVAVGVVMIVAAMAAADKVTICHKSSAPGQTQTVPQSAVSAHLAHGDSLGACSISPSR